MSARSEGASPEGVQVPTKGVADALHACEFKGRPSEDSGR